MKELRTNSSVVEHLGGLERLCAITGSNRKQAYNWVRKDAKFPAHTYVAMMRELERLGLTAKAQLWNMRGL